MPAGTSRRQRLQVTTKVVRVDGPWNIPKVLANIKRISTLPAADLKDANGWPIYRVPVAIDIVAQRLNLTVSAAPLGEKASGMLVVMGERGVIGCNSSHPRVRQRFTISHEIAHSLLHAKKIEKTQLFIDSSVTFRRAENSSARADREEVEANQLGAALLIPKGLVLQEVKRNELDLDDEEAMSLLAKSSR